MWKYSPQITSAAIFTSWKLCRIIAQFLTDTRNTAQPKSLGMPSESRYSRHMFFRWKISIAGDLQLYWWEMRFCVEHTLTILSVLEAEPVQIYNFCRRFVVVILFDTYILLIYFHDELKFINHSNVGRKTGDEWIIRNSRTNHSINHDLRKFSR